jgi:hypothetical protein
VITWREISGSSPMKRWSLCGPRLCGSDRLPAVGHRQLPQALSASTRPAQLFGATSAELSRPYLTFGDRHDIDCDIEATRQQLGDVAFAEASAAGKRPARQGQQRGPTAIGAAAVSLLSLFRFDASSTHIGQRLLDVSCAKLEHVTAGTWGGLHDDPSGTRTATALCGDADPN